MLHGGYGVFIIEADSGGQLRQDFTLYKNCLKLVSIVSVGIMFHWSE